MKDRLIQPGPSLSGALALLQGANLPTSDLTESHLSHFFFSGSATSPDGMVGLELLGSQALLRSLVVAPALRSSGLGGALLDHAERYASRIGVKSLYLLTTTAESFFRHRGYLPTDRANAPGPVRATREFADLCPASSAFMVKHLGV
jgi:amino-acid N-acetyltransferase